MKKILFNDDLLLKIKDNEPKFSIELLKSVVETSLNLREFVRENCKHKHEFNEKNYEENQQDYIMMIHQYEIEIKDRKNVRIFISFKQIFLKIDRNASKIAV